MFVIMNRRFNQVLRNLEENLTSLLFIWNFGGEVDDTPLLQAFGFVCVCYCVFWHDLNQRSVGAAVSLYLCDLLRKIHFHRPVCVWGGGCCGFKCVNPLLDLVQQLLTLVSGDFR